MYYFKHSIVTLLICCFALAGKLGAADNNVRLLNGALRQASRGDTTTALQVIDRYLGQPGREEAKAYALYLKGMLGFGQGNIASGDFSANISPGYLVRKGEIVGRVKDTMIAGNLLELMKQNVQLSSDYDEPGRIPWAIVDGVSVSSSAG